MNLNVSIHFIKKLSPLLTFHHQAQLLKEILATGGNAHAAVGLVKNLLTFLLVGDQAGPFQNIQVMRNRRLRHLKVFAYLGDTHLSFR
jgi:hypothetical protein